MYTRTSAVAERPLRVIEYVAVTQGEITPFCRTRSSPIVTLARTVSDSHRQIL